MLSMLDVTENVCFFAILYLLNYNNLRCSCVCDLTQYEILHA
jgi:hypothetical protein